MASNSSSNLVVQHQLTGLETNCYLLYDPGSRDAAIIDVAGPVDELLATVKREDLNLRFFLFTHGHLDHIIGLPTIRDDFPDAMVCMHILEFQNMQTHNDWVDKWAIKTLGEELIAEWMKDPEFVKTTEFDVSTFNAPDLYLEEGKILELGKKMIRILHCPGHSPGGLCYSIDNLLFSGDVLFKGSVGRVDVQNSSRDDQIQSVRRLYKEFDDNTIVYPGHLELTTIGAERVGNQKVSEIDIAL
ncbi:MAG: MBL fold metallo-hydrolase [Anaerolineaceae bacterium]|nr:MBL fold metallo-hydrolase [Anaerolineaceae bacterium]